MQASRLVVFLTWLVTGCLEPGGQAFDPGESSVPDPDPDPVFASDPVPLPSCPAYPIAAEGYGTRTGDLVENLSMAGNGPEDETWSMSDFWCMHAEGEATVVVLALLSLTCHCCLIQAPELEQWWSEYGPRGLVPVGVILGDGLDATRAYFEDDLGHTHPYIADPAALLAPYGDSDGDGMAGSPGFVVIDLETMRVAAVQEGYRGDEESLFEDLLR